MTEAVQSFPFQKNSLTEARLFYLVQGEGFEPPKAEPADLQSAVFDRFTIPAYPAKSGI
jgi:hypothetical protein